MSDYVERVDQNASNEKVKSVRNKKIDTPIADDSEKKKLTYKEKIEWETIEEDIATLEETIETLNTQMLDNSSDAVKLQELQATLTATEQTLEEKLERWEYLSEFVD